MYCKSNRRGRGRKLILRVVVADGHPVMREGQTDVLSVEGDIQVAGEVGTGEEAPQLVTEAPPDLVVLDLNLAGKPNAFELYRATKTLPGAPCLLRWLSGRWAIKPWRRDQQAR